LNNVDKQQNRTESISKSVFESLVIALGEVLAFAFAIIVVSALLESGEITGAFAAGFVNPFSTDIHWM
jgi:hypothetical protein